MKLEIFNEGDFSFICKEQKMSALLSRTCNQMVCDWISNNGRVIYGLRQVSGELSFDYQAEKLRLPPYTLKALLICIEPIEKCTHPPYKVTWQGYSLGDKCECGASVRVKEYEEVK